MERSELLRELVSLLDPHDAGETVNLRLQHETGARLQSAVLNSLPAEDVRLAFADLVARPIDGTPSYVASMNGVTITWPARRIDLGGGKAEYSEDIASLAIVDDAEAKAGRGMWTTRRISMPCWPACGAPPTRSEPLPPRSSSH